MEDDEDQKYVSIKVQVEKNKYRLYRLPKKQVRDRNNLWRAKHEVGRRITDLMKSRRTQIAELQRLTKKLEKSHANWMTLAKSLNIANEDFFLDAVLASEEDIEAFETDNFFTPSSWSKTKDVSELTSDEIAEMSASQKEEDLKDNLGDDNTRKIDHYSWISQHFSGNPSENVVDDKLVTTNVHNTDVLKAKKDLSETADGNTQQPGKDEKSATLIQIKEESIVTGEKVIEKKEVTDIETSSISVTSQSEEEKKKAESAHADETPNSPVKLEKTIQQMEPVVASTSAEMNREKTGGKVVAKVDDAQTKVIPKEAGAVKDLEIKEHQSLSPVEEVKKAEIVCNAASTNGNAGAVVVAAEKLEDLKPNRVIEKKKVSHIQTEPESKENTIQPEKNEQKSEEHDLKSEGNKSHEERVESKTDDTGSSSNLEANGGVKETTREETSNETEDSSPTSSSSSQIEHDEVKQEDGSQSGHVSVDIDASIATAADISSVSDHGESLDSEPQETFQEKHKKQLADPSGYSKLRLTSGSSSNDNTPTPPAPVKRSGNIWEQRAAEREEKLVAERKTSSSNSSTVSAFPSLNSMSHQPFKPAFSLVKKETVQKSVRVDPKTNQNGSSAAKTHSAVKETTKKTDPNGWITPATKKGKHNSGSFLKTMQEADTAAAAAAAAEKRAREEKEAKKANQPSPVQPSPAGKPEAVAKVDPPNAVTKQVENEAELDRKDDSVREKRAKRRQRVQEKAKQSAKQNKEEEKRAREQKRIEHEKKIEQEKREKEERQQKEWEQRNRDIAQIREERESLNRRRVLPVDKIQEMMECKGRVAVHADTKPIEYRLIESKVYLDKRINDLKTERMEISHLKQRTLEKYRNRITTNEAINLYLVFVSERVEHPGNSFKLEDLIDYLSDMAYNIAYEKKNFLQRAIFKCFQEYCETKRLKDADNLVKSLNYINTTLKKLVELPVLTGEQDKMVRVLTNYSKLHHTAQEYINVTAYLYTRMNQQFFLVEEDYLLTCADIDSVANLEKSGKDSSTRKPPRPEERSEEENPPERMEVDEYDDEEEETIHVIDMSCQTDQNGEPVDLLALSRMPPDEN